MITILFFFWPHFIAPLQKYNRCGEGLLCTKPALNQPCGPNLLHCGAFLKGSVQLSLQCCAWMSYRSPKEKKKQPTLFSFLPCLHKGSNDPHQQVISNPWPPSHPRVSLCSLPQGNNLPFSSAAVVEHLAVNRHGHTLQAPYLFILAVEGRQKWLIAAKFNSTAMAVFATASSLGT